MLTFLRNACRAGFLALAVALAAPAALHPVMAAEVRIAGTGNAIGTMQRLADAYTTANPAARATVLKSIGTSGAIKAVSRNAIAIGLSSRPLTTEEESGGLAAIEYARCPTVFAVQDRNPATDLTTDQFVQILRGRLTTWPDGTPIRPVLRQPGDDNTRQVRQLSPAVADAIDRADRRPGAIVASTDQEAADKLENIPGSIGVTTAALIRSENRRLRELTLNGVEPSVEHARSGRYPLVKRFFFVVRKPYSADVGAFMQFVASPDGQRILLQTGHYLP